MGEISSGISFWSPNFSQQQRRMKSQRCYQRELSKNSKREKNCPWPALFIICLFLTLEGYFCSPTNIPFHPEGWSSISIPKFSSCTLYFLCLWQTLLVDLGTVCCMISKSLSIERIGSQCQAVTTRWNPSVTFRLESMTKNSPFKHFGRCLCEDIETLSDLQKVSQCEGRLVRAT